MPVTINGSGQVVVQIVTASTATEVTNSTSTYADTGLTATITPTSSSNRILVLVSQNGCGKSNNDTRLRLRLMRGVTQIAALEELAGYTGNTNANGIGSISCAYLDSPATTLATTYKTQFMSHNNNAVVLVQWNSTPLSTITLMEISG